MCVAIAKPRGVKLPERDILKICFKNNPDGAGFVFNRNGKNHVYKGFFTFGDFWRALIACEIKDDEGALIHFRVATHGGISKGTCHPFLICDNFEWMKMDACSFLGDVMIHNGQLNFFIPKPEISDSMMLAKKLYKYDRSVEENQFFLEMALINNDTKKMNRVAIIDCDGKIELYGHKEPWKNVDGCFYSNESFRMNFSRTTYYSNYQYNQTPTKEQIEKFDYDEEDVASNKISLCYNRKNGCKNLGEYKVYYDDKNYNTYCNDCYQKIDSDYCKSCQKIKTVDSFNKSNSVCDSCISNKEEFFALNDCDYCNQEKAYKKVVVAETENGRLEKYLCKNCFKNFNAFHCDECNTWFTEAFLDSHYNNLCLDCYGKLTQYSKDCTYCKSTNDLYKTSFSSVCSRCLKDKKAIKCVKCRKLSLYSEKNYGDRYGICSTCRTSVKHILECYKNFNVLTEDERNNIIKEFDKSTIDNQLKIIGYYEDDLSIFSYKILLKKVKALLGFNNITINLPTETKK